MKVGVAKETAPNERRVALTPEALGKLQKAGLEILVEQGAGDGASYPDEAYSSAGATVVDRDALYQQADVIVKVQKPDPAEARLLRSGQALIAFLSPLSEPELPEQLGQAGVTAISLESVPRISRAQTMDALSSQANVGGYKAVLIAAAALGRYFPLLMTAAGTAPPAKVLILGIGVAGLQAIATARRLGASVSAYDVRPETKEQAESLGATFVTLKSVGEASGTGGYARELTAEERAAQQQELNRYIAESDVVVTTAQVPGRKAPVLVSEEAIKGMKPGTVIVDMAAEQGGNAALTKAGEVVTTPNGVFIHGPLNLPSTMASGASLMYARNIAALLLHFVKDGAMHYDFEDEITRGSVISHGGKLVHEATLAQFQAKTAVKG
ncbi:MAG: Re/Si-specific NAD(P)(+) transhydrogenase subunit alpha [Chloroflexi bacterium]|nr:Re/Si-specific NAD(P)(+) transhydrogenase subunit alpha [Chloroflexota bacterium]